MLVLTAIGYVARRVKSGVKSAQFKRPGPCLAVWGDPSQDEITTYVTCACKHLFTIVRC